MRWLKCLWTTGSELNRSDLRGIKIGKGVLVMAIVEIRGIARQGKEELYITENKRKGPE